MKVEKGVVRYCAFWLELLLVSIGVWATYTALLKPLPHLLGILPWVNWAAISEEPAWFVVRKRTNKAVLDFRDLLRWWVSCAAEVGT